MTTPDDLRDYYTPRGAQLAIAGDDWTSDHDRKAQARAEAARKKAGLACAKKLDAAIEGLRDYLRACNECRDGSGDERMGAGDGRALLISRLAEYSVFLESRYDKC